MSAPFGAAADADTYIRAREKSVLVGIVEHRIWRAYGPTKKEAWQFKDAVIAAARKFDDATKTAGARMGEIGLTGLKVLEVLFSFTDLMSGRLEPSIASIMERAKLARDTVVKALARLRNAGFLDWVRRKEDLGAKGAGPQIHQATNAYWFKLRGRAAGLVKLALRKLQVPVPDDAAARSDMVHQETEDMLDRGNSDDVAGFYFGNDSFLRDVFASLGRAVETSASPITGRNPNRKD